jgi:hypothetical protein
MTARTARVAWLLVALGCSRGPQFVAVSGRVTLDGEPLAGASVQFSPVAPPGSVEAPGPGSTGVTDADGRYTLTVVGGDRPGAVTGEHQVRIYTAFAAGRGDAGGTERLPARYHAATELRFTVKPGGQNTADWSLTSR